MPRLILKFTTALLVAMTPCAALAQEIPTKRIQFAKGASSAVVEGQIKGDQTIDYLVGARQGQSLNASMATKNTSAYFNIMAPGSKDEAFFIGSTSGNQYEGTLEASGDYRIRVYLMRSAARRNETAKYRLEVIITGGAAAHDAKVAGTPYHATGTIPCSTGTGAPTGQCAFGVVRHPGGSADVTVTLPDGRKRVIFFQQGKPVGADVSQADQKSFSASKQADLNIVMVGNERFEIPDAVVLGG